MIDWGGGGGVYKLMEEQGEKGTAGIPTEFNLGGTERSTGHVGPMRRSEDEGCSGGDLEKCVGVWGWSGRFQGGGEGCVREAWEWEETNWEELMG